MSETPLGQATTGQPSGGAGQTGGGQPTGSGAGGSGPSLGEVPLGSAGVVRLFGCAVAGITVTPGGLGGRLASLAAPKLAWIYGFAFEGHYYDLAKPTIFVVDDAQEIPFDDKLQVTGLPAEPPEFYDDVRVWVVDRDDLGLRLDLESGTFQRILLEAELQGDRAGGAYAGASVRMSGASLRMSGASLRMSGASVAVGGASRFLAGDPRRTD